MQIEPGRYLWDGLDWIFNELAPQERDYSPLFTGIIYGNFGWMTCPAYTNPDGSVGFYDPNNTYLLEQYGAYVRELTARYAPELRFIETGNEPCYGFYLCPCIDPGGPPCDASSGPNQPACELGPDSEEFAQTYGPFLSTSANVAAEAMAEANPDAILIAGTLEKSGADLTATSRTMIEHGLLDRGNVALMIHQFPLPSPNWLAEPVNCAYFQDPNDPWWLPAGCQTAPPFDDYTTPAGRPIHAQDMWRGIDEKIDASLLLHDAEDLGVLDRFTLFDTELHAGWHDNFRGEPNETTTPAREAMLGLRIGAINAHQRYLGLQFIFAPTDPTPYNLLVKHLAGATPVYAWDAPLTDADYSGLVYKLFTRGDEDIIALWSNAEGPLELALTPSADPISFKQVTLTRLVDAQGAVAITTTGLSAPPASITVQPLREFIFLSVISDRPGFGWLAGIALATITDLASNQSLPFSVVDGNLVLSLALGPWQSRVLQVSGGEPSASLIYLPLVLSQWHAPPTPPVQPASGPGGRDYPHASYIVTERGLGNGKYWVYQPADPRPETALAVVFLHGWGAMTTNPYRFWLEHLVRKGNIVIYPKYQATRFTLTNTFMENAIGAVKDALDWLE